MDETLLEDWHTGVWGCDWIQMSVYVCSLLTSVCGFVLICEYTVHVTRDRGYTDFVFKLWFV